MPFPIRLGILVVPFRALLCFALEALTGSGFLPEGWNLMCKVFRSSHTSHKKILKQLSVELTFENSGTSLVDDF